MSKLTAIGDLVGNAIQRNFVTQIPKSHDPEFIAFSKALMDMFSLYTTSPRPLDNAYESYWATLKPLVVNKECALLDIIAAMRMAPYFSKSFPLCAGQIGNIAVSDYTNSDITTAFRQSIDNGCDPDFSGICQLIKNNRKRSEQDKKEKLKLDGKVEFIPTPIEQRLSHIERLKHLCSDKPKECERVVAEAIRTFALEDQLAAGEISNQDFLEALRVSRQSADSLTG